MQRTVYSCMLVHAASVDWRHDKARTMIYPPTPRTGTGAGTRPVVSSNWYYVYMDYFITDSRQSPHPHDRATPKREGFERRPARHALNLRLRQFSARRCAITHPCPLARMTHRCDYQACSSASPFSPHFLSANTHALVFIVELSTLESSRSQALVARCRRPKVRHRLGTLTASKGRALRVKTGRLLLLA